MPNTPITPRTEQTLQQFKGWYSRTGHWVYEGKADALRTWIRWGIKTMPTAPANAEALLADWVRA